MSFCSECGAALPSDARFCMGCGTPTPPRTTDAGQPTDDAGQPTDASSGSTAWTAPQTSVQPTDAEPTTTEPGVAAHLDECLRSTESDGVATFSYEEDTAYDDDEEEWESATSEETFSMRGEVTTEGDSLSVT